MREIKFRAWYPEEDRMEYQSGKTPIWVGDILADSYYVPMQFTGLVDKNGVEIYEGDIVCHEHEKGVAVVKFGKGYQGEPADGMYPYWGWYTDGWFDRYAFSGADVEVIGNIYEDAAKLSNAVDKERG